MTYGCVFHYRQVGTNFVFIDFFFIFHLFLQAVRRYMQRCCLVSLENENGDFRLLVKLAGVLTYMPPEKVFRFWKDGVQSLVKENMSGEGVG